MTKNIFLILLLLICRVTSFAITIDTIKVPFQRQIFHDKINGEQKLLDKADGKIDGMIKVSADNDINLAVTDAIIRGINELQDSVEVNKKLAGHREKVM